MMQQMIGEPPYFWDIIGPISLSLFAIMFVLSIYALKRKYVSLLLVATLVSFAVAYITAWSFSPYILIIALLQFIALIYIIIKKRNR